MATQQRRLPRPQTSFVGRHRDLESLRGLLGDSKIRLITLLGPGGVGKTRLALRVADEFAGQFVHGWEFVDLSNVETAELVPEAVARALGLELEREHLTEQLSEHLSSRNVLIVLDNFEQVIEAEPFVAELLEACPDLVVLITSRRVLNIRAATNYFVDPLALPDPASTPTPELAASNEAVRLFIDRAQAADARFALTKENVPHVVAICRRLEGVPLAIELAAARTRVLTVEMIGQRLDPALHLLSGGPRDAPERQQSLRALIDWSYRLLSVDEQALLQRVSLFLGGFTLERLRQLEAEIVRLSGAEPASGDTLDRLQALVDASLLHRIESGDGERFRMLESIRSFAAIEIGASDTAELMREAHARVVLAVAEGGKAGLLGPDPARWSDLLETEIENIRAALRWAVSSPGAGPELALKLCNAIWLFWKRSLRLAEGRDWLERSLLAAGDIELIEVGNVQVLLGHSIFDDPVASGAAYERGLEIYRRFGDRRRIAGATISLASTMASMGRDQEALEHYRESAAIFEEMGLVADLAVVDAQIGRLYLRTSQYDLAQRHLDRSTLASTRLNDLASAAETRFWLGRLMYEQGKIEEAKNLFLLCRAESEQLRIEDLLNLTLCELGAAEFFVGNRSEGLALYRQGLVGIRDENLYIQDAIDVLYHGIGLMSESRRNADAVRLLGAVERLGTRFNVARTSVQVQNAERRAAGLKRAVGVMEFDRLKATGETMSILEAIDFVIAENFPLVDPTPRAQSLPPINTVLTRREAEVVCLLGYTDREIAERLFVGVRTVTTHVSHILGKLDVSTRSAAIAIAVRFGWCKVD
jgi:non-specific serine/threonine protein kinase